jgi:hypothetical protein
MLQSQVKCNYKYIWIAKRVQPGTDSGKFHSSVGRTHERWLIKRMIRKAQSRTTVAHMWGRIADRLPVGNRYTLKRMEVYIYVEQKQVYWPRRWSINRT